VREARGGQGVVQTFGSGDHGHPSGAVVNGVRRFLCCCPLGGYGACGGRMTLGSPGAERVRVAVADEPA